MTLIRRFQGDVEPYPASDARGRSGFAAAWLVDGKYAWAVTLMVVAMYLTLIVPSALFSGEVHELVADEPSPYYRAVKFALIGSSALILVWRYALAARLLRELNVFLLAYVALVFLSAMWSIEPDVTLRRSVLVFTTCVVCAAFVMVAWHPRRFQEVLRPVLTGFLVASLILGALEPNLGRELGDTSTLAGSWRGVFGQKNGLGEGVSLAAVFWLHAWLAKEMRFGRFAVGMGVCIACVVLSRSSTALFSLIFSASLLFLLMKGFSGRRRYIVLLVMLFVSLILFYSLVALKILPDLDFLLQPIVALTGKDMTFSGRSQVWDVVREHIKLHPLLGTGYGAYWIGPVPRSPSILTMARFSDYYPGEAHDGYLDVINDLGYVGLICLLGYILVYLRQSLVLLRVDYNQGVLYLTLLFGALITNLTESSSFSCQRTSFVVSVQVVFALARAALDRRMRAAPAVRRAPLLSPTRPMLSTAAPRLMRRDVRGRERLQRTMPNITVGLGSTSKLSRPTLNGVQRSSRSHTVYTLARCAAVRLRGTINIEPVVATWKRAVELAQTRITIATCAFWSFISANVVTACVKVWSVLWFKGKKAEARFSGWVARLTFVLCVIGAVSLAKIRRKSKSAFTAGRRWQRLWLGRKWSDGGAPVVDTKPPGHDLDQL